LYCFYFLWLFVYFFIFSVTNYAKIYSNELLNDNLGTKWINYPGCVICKQVIGPIGTTSWKDIPEQNLHNELTILREDSPNIACSMRKSSDFKLGSRSRTKFSDTNSTFLGFSCPGSKSYLSDVPRNWTLNNKNSIYVRLLILYREYN
jgi:hypothetical protein